MMHVMTVMTVSRYCMATKAELISTITFLPVIFARPWSF